MKKKGKNLENSIASVSSSEKIIRYYNYDFQKQRLVRILEETYEEAVQNIKFSNYTLGLSS